MTTEDFIIELSCRVNDKMAAIMKHSQALLCSNEIVTLGLLFALMGKGSKPFAAGSV